ncbi:MAG: aminotransferase [Actinomycetota bacterium]|nr:aminotransferase [Actinomycetota bacterium]
MKTIFSSIPPRRQSRATNTKFLKLKAILEIENVWKTGTDMKALFIEHDHLSPLGHVGEAISDLGYDIEEFVVVKEENFTNPYLEVEFPDQTSFDIVIYLGAPWAVYDESLPWVNKEISMIRQSQELNQPILGICFGGQLLAKANGANVRASLAKEIGWHYVTSTDESIIPSGPYFQWHGDCFDTPRGALELAFNGAANQAFSIERSLALQFHPEVELEALTKWVDNGGREEAEAIGIDLERVVAQTILTLEESRLRSHQLVRNFHKNFVAR